MEKKSRKGGKHNSATYKQIKYFSPLFFFMVCHLVVHLENITRKQNTTQFILSYLLKQGTTKEHLCMIRLLSSTS